MKDYNLNVNVLPLFRRVYYWHSMMMCNLDDEEQYSFYMYKREIGTKIIQGLRLTDEFREFVNEQEKQR